MSAEWEWPWLGPQRVRRTVGFALFLLGVTQAYVFPSVHWRWNVASWALPLGFVAMLPIYTWPWRTSHPVVATITTAWALLGYGISLAFRGESRSPRVIVYEDFWFWGLMLFVVWSSGRGWFGGRRRSPPRAVL